MDRWTCTRSDILDAIEGRSNARVQDFVKMSLCRSTHYDALCIHISAAYTKVVLLGAYTSVT